MPQNRFIAFMRRHPVWTWVAAALIVLLGLLAYTGLRVWSMTSPLLALNDLTDTIADHVDARDLDAVGDDLRDAQRLAADASNASDDWAVWLAAHQPVFGNEIETLRVVSQAAGDLTSSATPLVELLPRLSAGAVTDNSGFDIPLLKNLDTAVSSLATAVTASSAKLATLADRPVIPQLQRQLTTLSDALAQAGPALDNLQPFVQALPIILGENGPRTWFVTLQNLTEVRPTGGLIAGYVIVKAEDGTIRKIAQGTNDDLNAGARPDYSFMPQGLQDIWGETLADWLSMNLSAHFPYTAELITDGWNKNDKAQIDGVLALGQGTVQYLAAASGAVEVKGRVIPPDQLMDYLTVGIYEDYPNVRQKDAAVARIVGSVFDRLASGNFDVASLVTTALTASSADRLQLWSADRSEERKIDAIGLSGSLPDEYGPYSTVRVINAGGNKLDAFLRLEASYELSTCLADPDTRQQYRDGAVAMTLTNNAPTEGLPDYMVGRLDLEPGDDYVRGSNHLYALVYAPRSAQIGDVLQNGEPAFTVSNFEREHEFFMFDVVLDPGQSTTVEVQWREPANSPTTGIRLDAEPTLTTQPLINQPTLSATAEPCT